MRYLHCTMIFLIRNSHFDLYYLYSSTIIQHMDDKWDEVEVKCVPKTIEAWVMQCSDYVEILKPIELRNRIFEKCKGILERYR